ncbi:GNAT family N-acetyltransferase [Pigmentiphaga soli]|uniref:GNAT family N-acetyltransferase n=1 Tax=Pigmentiphaga soli TaxID=1007095 RepID=A0ABP8HPH9_9BURK
MTIQWSRVAAPDLDAARLYALLALRAEIFVVEQRCAYQDVDGRDLLPSTLHVLGWRGQRLAACLRVLDDAAHGRTAIGRVCVAAPERGRGHGHELMRQGMQAALQRWPERPVYLSAQSHLQGFYAAHGFAPVTGPYLEDGIPHVGMTWRPARPPLS